MNSCLQLVSEQFPHMRDRVTCLFEQDDIFRELCEDYEACRLALLRQPASDALSREYAALRLRLEVELLRHINEAELPRPRK
jgi:hypothetical protein